MIDFTEKTVCVWFMSITATQDWMAALTEIEPGTYLLQYRFRYYSPESENPWDEKDRKNWYKGEIKAVREEAVARIRDVASAMLSHGAIGPLSEVMNFGDYNDFLKRFQEQPWVFAKHLTEEEAAKLPPTES